MRSLTLIALMSLAACSKPAPTPPLTQTVYYYEAAGDGVEYRPLKRIPRGMVVCDKGGCATSDSKCLQWIGGDKPTCRTRNIPCPVADKSMPSAPAKPCWDTVKPKG